MKQALITGITGQDGSYLAELLLSKGYEVHAIVRRTSNFNISRIAHLFDSSFEAELLLEKGHQVPKSIEIDAQIPNNGSEIAKKGRLTLYYGDLADSSTLGKLIYKIQPDEIYNLAAQSHVRVSFDIPEYTSDVVGMGPLRILEAIKNYSPQTKLYQASSSEMFGKVKEVPQSENTPFHPRSPYGCSKVFAYWLTINYRESYGLHASNGILFNHESPRRGNTFVTRKISKAMAEIKLGKRDILELGNLDSQRDWGHAEDYVNAMWLMLQQDKGDDYVIGSGETHTVREFTTLAAKALDIELEWSGEGVNEVGINKETGETVVKVNPDYFRPAEVSQLLSDPTKAKNELGWKLKYSFEDLINDMVTADFEREKEK